jgi:O-antigen/teichoic acid export membrane protein
MVTWQALSFTALWQNFRTRVVARKFVQNVGVLTVANLVGAVLNFVQAILVARWLGPELYGVVALVMSYPSLIYTLFDARSVAASMKYLGEYHAKGEADRALAICKFGYLVDFVIAGVTFSVLLFTAHLVAENIIHDPTVASLMIVYGGALMIRALVGTSNAVLATLGRFPVLASIEMATTFLRVALITGFVLAGWQVKGVIWANAVAAVATGLVYGTLAWVLIRRTWGGSIFHGDLKSLNGGWREIFGFLVYTDLTSLVATIPNQLDLLVLGYFRNPTEVGYYKLAKSISVVVRYVTKPLQTVTYPELNRLAVLGHAHAFGQKVRKLLTWIGLPLGVLVLLGTALISFVLPIVVGEAYLPALHATQLLCAGAGVSLAFFWTRPVYLATGQVQQMFLISSSVIVVFALLYPFAVREWGYMGSAIWMLSLQIVGTSVSASWLWKRGIARAGVRRIH